MSDVSDAAEKIRKAAEAMVGQDQRIADDAKASLNASGRESKAALDASDRQSQASLGASIESAHADQRAWVVPSAFKLSEEPALDKEVTITVAVLNTGRTPALESITQSQLFLWNIEPPVIDFPIPVNPPSKPIIPPGIGGTTFTSDPLKLTTTQQMDAYTSKMNKIYIEAIVRYKDVFNTAHWIRICAFHVSGTPLDTFNFCQNGNEIEQGQDKQQAK